jgi:hypothetical protein
MARSYQLHDQLPVWRTILRRMSGTAYSVYFLLPSLYGGSFFNFQPQGVPRPKCSTEKHNRQNTNRASTKVTKWFLLDPLIGHGPRCPGWVWATELRGDAARSHIDHLCSPVDNERSTNNMASHFIGDVHSLLFATENSRTYPNFTNNPDDILLRCRLDENVGILSAHKLFLITFITQSCGILVRLETELKERRNGWLHTAAIVTDQIPLALENHKHRESGKEGCVSERCFFRYNSHIHLSWWV